VLSIAGSDSGGGAGIQADLKAFAVCRVHGMTAVTALTAQNTVEVTEIHQVPPEMILAQIRTVSTDIGIDAVKIGMLGDAPTIEAVARGLDELPGGIPVVLDPVMVSESGAILLDPEAQSSLVDLLLPRATVITPNVPEARALLAARASESAGASGSASASGSSSASGSPSAPETADDAEVANLARALHALGPRFVVVTGGHRDRAIDVCFDGHEILEIAGELYPGAAAHGSGCTHSSVLAARLAWGDTPPQAARVAKELAALGVKNRLSGLGAGAGPVDLLGLGSLT
jgi:hydroxymethylpyrimidine/phosphomethylpyrimidine kinase